MRTYGGAKMEHRIKTNGQQLKELSELRQRIVELEKSQTDLMQAEEKYRNIFERCIEGIYQVTPEGRFISANPSAARLLGYDSPEDLINSVTDIRTQVYACPEDRDKAMEVLRNYGLIQNFEMKWRRKDGKIIWGILNARLVQDDLGNTVYIEGTNQDITQRKEMEEALHESEEKYRSLVDYAYDAIIIAGFDGNLLGVNQRSETLLGYTQEELLGMNVSQLHPQEERGRILTTFRHMVEGKTHSLLDSKVLRKDGTTVPVDIVGGALTYGGRQVAQGIFRDITEHKQMEESLKKSEQRFRALSEASLEAIVFIEDGVIVDANKALGHLFGYEGEDLRGKLATDFIVPERRAFTDERMQTRTEGLYETFGLRKDGSVLPIEVNAREFEQDGKKLRVSAVRDLTERKKIEKQLKDYQDHLERLVEERTIELKESEKKYRDIFENAIEGIYQTTPEGCFLTANPALAHMYGYENPEELLQSITNIATQIYVDPERRKDFINAVERDGFVQDFEIQVRRKDGFTGYVSINARAIKDENGRTLFFEGTNQDITEKKLAQEQLMLQRDLALKLCQDREPWRKAWPSFLRQPSPSSGMECGGISLKNRRNGWI